MQIQETCAGETRSPFPSSFSSPIRAEEADPILDFASSVAAGLDRSPRLLESRFLYDDEGSRLYDRITRQPEYYLTRAEAAILEGDAPRIREMAGPATLVELGAGSAEKTGHLFRAWETRSSSVSYVPVDVSRSALEAVCRTMPLRHPGVTVTPLHGRFEEAFPMLAALSPVMLTFLGSTIGNMDDREMSSFLASVSAALTPEDWFLLGIDLVKEPHLIEAAYNDAAGVTERFTRNLFGRMNRELGSSIDLDQVEHVARYNEALSRVEVHARFRKAQTIEVAPLEKSYHIDAGEMIRTEICRKFRLEEFASYLEGFGLETREIFSDPGHRFALLLVQPRADIPPLLS